MKENKLLPINIQLFAEQEEDLKDLVNELSGEQETNPDVDQQKTQEELDREQEVSEEENKKLEEQKALEEENKKLEEEAKNKNISVDELKKQKEEEKVKKEKEEEDKKKGGISELRKAHDEEKKARKTLEDNKVKLLKAIKLGIKGETEEEILANLEAHEVKEEANKSGLTEDQIRKQKELEDKMSKLNTQQQEIVFNQRAFNLQKEKNLSEQQVLDFVKTAGELGINLFTNTVNFTKIYERIFPTSSNTEFEKIRLENEQLKKQIEELKDDKAPGAGTKGNPTLTGSEKDLDEILNKLGSKK